MLKGSKSGLRNDSLGSDFDTLVETIIHRFGSGVAAPLMGTSDFRWQSELWYDRAATLIRSEYSAPWRVKAAEFQGPGQYLPIILPARGAIDVSLGRRLVECTVGQALLVNRYQGDSYVTRGEPHKTDVLCLDWASLAFTIAGLVDTPLNRPLEFSPLVHLRTPAGRPLEGIVSTIVAGMEYDGLLLRSPIAMSHIAQALADLIARTVAHRFSHLVDKRCSQIAPWRLRKAIEYMNENIGEAIAMTSVAEAVLVSVRALENGFRSVKDTTPAAYLRGIRLRAAQQVVDPLNRQSVRGICQKWGFLHFGRFAGPHRAVYGQTPSDATRRSATH